jgi:hypothetical protein
LVGLEGRLKKNKTSPEMMKEKGFLKKREKGGQGEK